MLLAAAVIAEAMQRVVIGSAKAANIVSASFLGSVTRWAIWIFGFILALSQVGIGGDYLIIFFQGVVVALALGLGLSFGLGGKDAAARAVDKMSRDVSKNM